MSRPRINDFQGSRSVKQLDLSLDPLHQAAAKEAMGMALYMVSEQCGEEAVQFADQCLDLLLLEPEVLVSEDSAELLRRYALIAAITGATEDAYIATTLALLVILIVSGVESDADMSFLKLVDDWYLLRSPRPIEQVGRCIAEHIGLRRLNRKQC